MALVYDPTAGYLFTALQLYRSAIPSVVRRFEFWLFFALHLGVFYAYGAGYLAREGDSFSVFRIDWNDMQVITAITTFFEVFYTNQCYNRYVVLYRATRDMLGNMHDYCFEVRLHLRHGCRSHTRLAARHLIAATLMFFYEMNAEVSDKEWAQFRQQGLLKPQEVGYLRGVAGQRSLVLLQWSAEAVQAAHAKANAPSNCLKSMVDKLLRCRTLQQEVFDTVSLQMPFQYFHLLKGMLVVNLSCWAWAMGMTESVFAPVVFFFAALIFMGMMELAAQLSDPFGDDDVDFPMDDWLDEFVENTVILLEFEVPTNLLPVALHTEKSRDLGSQLSRMIRRKDTPADDPEGGPEVPLMRFVEGL